MSDIEIAQQSTMLPIIDIAAEKFNIPAENLDPYGHYKAKISLEYIDSLTDKKDGKLILVTAVSPTPAGEGKTTTTVGLGDAMNRLGKKTIMCLREPSLGPCFGIKVALLGVVTLKSYRWKILTCILQVTSTPLVWHIIYYQR